MNRDMKRAVGEFGEQGDVEAIMESVERLMGIYKRALLWRQSFSLIDTKEEYRNLMEIFFSLISNSVLVQKKIRL